MIQIRLRNIPEQVDPSLLSEGYLYLDLSQNFDIVETKQITELTPENEFKLNYTVSSDLELTPRNYEALKNFLLVTIDPSYRFSIAVDIELSGRIKTDVNLYVKQLEGGKLQIEFTFSDTSWVKRLAGKLLKDVSKPEELDEQVQGFSLYSELRTKNVYQDGDVGLYPIIADFGRFQTDLPLAYVRYCHHVLPLLRDIFCDVGLKFSSPFFESTIGRMLVDYLIDPNLGSYIDDDVHQFDAERRVDEAYEVGGYRYIVNESDNQDLAYRPIKFPEVIYNEGSWMGEDYYAGAMDAEVNLNLQLYVDVKDIQNVIATGSGLNASVSVYRPRIEIVRYNVFDGKIIDILHKFPDIEIEGETEYSVELTGISLTYNERVAVFLVDPANAFEPNNSDTNIEIKIGKVGGEDDELTWFKAEGIRNYLVANDEFSVMDLINPSIDVLGYLKDKSRQFQLKWYYNPVELTIYAFQPYEVKILDEKIEGFIIETDIEDIIEKIDQSKPKVINPPEAQPRYVKVGYKESTDPIVINKDLYSSTIDLGEKYTVDEPLETRLEIFEPTKQVILGGRRARPNAPSTEIFGFESCIMRSSEEVEHHYNLAPRTLVAWGEKEHGEAGGIKRKLNIGNDPTINIPTVLHMPGLLDGEVPKFCLIFGFNDALIAEHPGKEIYWNLWELMHKRDTLEQLDNQSLQYLTDISGNEFQHLNFRKLYMIQHFGRPVTVRMQSIDNFINRARVSTPITYIPFKFISNICDVDVSEPTGNFPNPPPFNGCNNNVYIDVQENFGGHIFTIMGEIGSFIESVTFEVSDDGGETWLILFNDSPISASRYDATGDYLVRAYITFGDLFGEPCEDQTIGPVVISICPEESDWQIFCSIFSVNGLGICGGYNIEVAEDAVPPGSLWIADPIEYSINGNTWAVFPESQNVCGIEAGTTFYVRAQINVGNCPPFEITSECEVVSTCEDNNVDIQWTYDEFGCPIPTRDGQLMFTLTDEDYDDYILIRFLYDGEWTQWRRWDEVENLCGDWDCIQAKRTVIFCNDLCPVGCSEIIEICDGCIEPFEPGQPGMTAYCNDGDVS